MSHKISPVSHSSSESEPPNLLMSHYVFPNSLHVSQIGQQITPRTESLHLPKEPPWLSKGPLSYSNESLHLLHELSHNPNEPHHILLDQTHLTTAEFPKYHSLHDVHKFTTRQLISYSWVDKLAIIHPKRNYVATIHVISKYPPRFTLHWGKFVQLFNSVQHLVMMIET